ncbi:Proton-dependent oligopeptide transporter family protein [Dioscorea alata]|uniref:Proton-dependent oligopeptide transporter family protein n=1 Tax=Dioscorea alata TaxID=55571 RepID=A0ACB7UPS9_DIOAL|nr:Proton-dependent oligopeptide transporter family protein [Dioscorea alata]
MAELPEVANGCDHELTKDGTVDLKGRPCFRSRGGRWKACSYIVGYEVFERMAFYGIGANLVLYLTKKLHENTVSSANNVTDWAGTVWMTPIIGAYIADAFLGRYWTFIFSSIIYLMGMILLTLTVSIPSLRPPKCGNEQNECDIHASKFQVGIFYCALYIIAIGTGGTKPNISTMGADQFDDFHPKERSQKLSFFNWWMFSIFFGTLFANSILVYIQDHVGFAVGYALPTFGLMFSVLVFLIGTPYYRHKLPSGSPFTKIAAVLVAAIRKSNVPLPDDPNELHELDDKEYARVGKSRISSTPSLRCLNKAAVKTGDGETEWKLCTVTQVEETKQMIKMLPVLMVTFIPSVMIAQVNTLFIKQGATLERNIGPHFQIPPASLTTFVTLFMLISLLIYDRLFVPVIRKYTKNPRGITLLQRMGIGMVLHIIIMLTASLVERKRLSVAKQYGLTDKKAIIPLSIFILLPQFALMGVADTFVDVAKLEFFYDQAPESMKSLGTSYFTTSLGVGNFLSSILLSTVAEITKRNGSKGWIQDSLNSSHLDYYYLLFAVLSGINLLFFLVVSKYYVYNTDVVHHGIEMKQSSVMLSKIVATSDS